MDVFLLSVRARDTDDALQLDSDR